MLVLTISLRIAPGVTARSPSAQTRSEKPLGAGRVCSPALQKSESTSLQPVMSGTCRVSGSTWLPPNVLCSEGKRNGASASSCNHSKSFPFSEGNFPCTSELLKEKCLSFIQQYTKLLILDMASRSWRYH